MNKMIPLCLALASCAGYSKKDFALEGIFAVEMAIDYGQSAKITKTCTELNPAIGACGERIPISIWFPTTFILHAIAVNYLPGDWKTLVEGLTVGGEGSTIWANFRDGVNP